MPVKKLPKCHSPFLCTLFLFSIAPLALILHRLAETTHLDAYGIASGKSIQNLGLDVLMERLI